MGRDVTIRIDFIRRADRTIIRLIGQFEAEHLSELMAQIGAAADPIVIEMQEVMLVDLDVVRFLTKCEAQGITLRGCSAYIREWIDRERKNET
jgi:hypothetical protein